jgi:hypothetical protein
VTEAATPPDERLARKPLVEVEFSFGPRNGLMARLLKRLIKPFGQRIAARPIVAHGLLKQGFAPSLLLSQNLLRVIQLRLIVALRFEVGYDTFQVRIDCLCRTAARTDHVEL